MAVTGIYTSAEFIFNSSVCAPITYEVRQEIVEIGLAR